MGRYKYQNFRLKRTAVWSFFAGLFGSSTFVIMYLFADSGEGLFAFLPEYVRPYALAFMLVVFLGIVYLGYRRMLNAPKIDGELLLDNGRLSMKVCRENRTEDVELDVKTLTFVENDDERIKVDSPQGEFIFNSSGFGSGEEYEKFRMELTCEKYKK